MNKIIDMCSEIQTHNLKFVLNPNEVWDTFDVKYKEITEQGDWHEVKFLNDDASALNDEVKKIPNNCGGIYIFILKGSIVPQSHLYILYIGRAQNTANQNLRKRIKCYISDDRPKIVKMRETWGKYIYVKYLPLEDNSIINGLESELIRLIIPPCNDVYSPKVTHQAMKAAF